MVRIAALILVLLLSGGSALAQFMAPEKPPDAASFDKMIGGEAQAFSLAQTHLFKAVADLLKAFRQAEERAAALDAYLKVCGDKPGCTQPVAP